MAVPRYDKLLNPLLQTLHELEGSASVSKMDEKATDIFKLSYKDVNEILLGSTTKLSNRFAGSR